MNRSLGSVPGLAFDGGKVGKFKIGVKAALWAAGCGWGVDFGSGLVFRGGAGVGLGEQATWSSRVQGWGLAATVG
jgi:hypothetical protein